MKKLNKEQMEQRETHSTTLHTAFEKIEANYSILEDMINDYNKDVDTFNEALAATREFVGEITADMNSYMEDKSEAWQEGDKGGEYAEWRDTWDQMELEDMEHLTMPDNPTDTTYSTIPDELRELPSEPG